MSYLRYNVHRKAPFYHDGLGDNIHDNKGAFLFTSLNLMRMDLLTL
jgi:hypothetical protein